VVLCYSKQCSGRNLQRVKKHLVAHTYGYSNWPELQATDAKNKKVFEALGFVVHELPNFHPFAYNSGAAHCVSKYLKRGET
jgi:hypothetical protein